MKIEVSNGEIVDKLTILEIKLEHISDPDKRKNILKEYEILEHTVAQIMDKNHELYQALKSVNLELWNIEDRIRELERRKEFGEEFIRTARAVYFTNDKRSEIKRKINDITGSSLTEEKSYEKYD